MKTNRRVWLSIVITLIFLAQPSYAQNKKVVVHIGQYSNDLHSVTMGLSLANMLQKEGAQVTIFLDREGVRLADKHQKALVYADSDAGKLYEEFIEGGGSVIVCPHCAELAGVKSEDLRKGSKLGTPGSIARLILDADTVVDY